MDSERVSTIATLGYPNGSEVIIGKLDISKRDARMINGAGTEIVELVERSISKGLAEVVPLSAGGLYIVSSVHRRDPSYVEGAEVRLFGRRFLD